MVWAWALLLSKYYCYPSTTRRKREANSLSRFAKQRKIRYTAV
ncbi:hypothetical protein HMPREF0372_02073 [Flavonifractor plautii ATCC 29863]|uniref:Uncharacterized protein n=1 Tax=Flavonifractor plautii ATCC 29863 TaxID=411475 RepID=G9YRC8_FLAPL|nr:hypothetical protein HMPREF0372_02073 [Flavonifractor plautii ATCC 29863]